MHYLKPFPEGGRFKKGERPKHWRPVGSETVNADGQVMVKVGLPSVWRPKYWVLWEEANGPLPKGARLIFADGNQHNIALDNLTLIQRPAIGDEKIGGDGFLHIKVAEPNKWKRKHYLIWEEAFGPVPKSHKLLFIDGRPGNCFLGNLVMVPKKENWRLKDIFAGEGARKRLIDLCCSQKQLVAPHAESDRETEASATPKPSRNDPRIRPLGAERVRKACGRIQIKVAHPKVWRFKHNMIWEEAHGPVPEGHVLKFIDGDCYNCTLGNLRLRRLPKRPFKALTRNGGAPLGTETVTKNNRILIKLANNVWRYKHRLVWEEAHGPIPKGYRIIFADNNSLNCEMDNLLMLSNEEIGQRMGYGLFFEDSDLNKNGAAILKLGSSIKKVKEMFE